MTNHTKLPLLIVAGITVLAVGFLFKGTVPELFRYFRIRRM
jgi:hypothetical protein